MEFDVEKIESDGRQAAFVVRGATPAFVNGVRRAMLADVPTLAIDTVDVYENTSVIFDEVLSLRLGLVPLTTDLEGYSLPEECSCEGEGCTACEVSVLLDVEAEDESVTVYSGDLEVEDPEIEPAEDNIPIIDLKPDQAVVLEATARLGRGRDHAKNQGATAAAYKHLNRVVEDGGRKEDVVRGYVEDQDGDLVDMSEFGGDVDEAFDADVGFETVDDAFVFEVESDGSHDVEQMVAEAALSLSERAEELAETIAT